MLCGKCKKELTKFDEMIDQGLCEKCFSGQTMKENWIFLLIIIVLFLIFVWLYNIDERNANNKESVQEISNNHAKL